MVKVKHDNELTELEAKAFEHAKEMAAMAMKVIKNFSAPFMNSLIKQNNGLDQVLVYSYFEKISTIIACELIQIMKDISDANGDNTCTIRSFAEDHIESIKIICKLKEPPLPMGIKRLKNDD